MRVTYGCIRVHTSVKHSIRAHMNEIRVRMRYEYIRLTYKRRANDMRMKYEILNRIKEL